MMIMTTTMKKKITAKKIMKRTITIMITRMKSKITAKEY